MYGGSIQRQLSCLECVGRGRSSRNGWLSAQKGTGGTHGMHSFQLAAAFMATRGIGEGRFKLGWGGGGYWAGLFGFFDTSRAKLLQLQLSE